MPLRRIKRRYEIEVCLDMGEERWVQLIKVCEQQKQIQKRYQKALEADPNAQMSDADFHFSIDF